MSRTLGAIVAAAAGRIHDEHERRFSVHEGAYRPSSTRLEYRDRTVRLKVPATFKDMNEWLIPDRVHLELRAACFFDERKTL
jgi:hypothetical protein